MSLKLFALFWIAKVLFAIIFKTLNCDGCCWFSSLNVTFKGEGSKYESSGRACMVCQPFYSILSCFVLLVKAACCIIPGFPTRQIAYWEFFISSSRSQGAMDWNSFFWEQNQVLIGHWTTWKNSVQSVKNRRYMLWITSFLPSPFSPISLDNQLAVC